ncbi:hypothetical protein PGIGA_G00054980, partial [Pangasianodon gigas]|nr:hypothetical protein [Pangasianodon gigas]
LKARCSLFSPVHHTWHLFKSSLVYVCASLYGPTLDKQQDVSQRTVEHETLAEPSTSGHQGLQYNSQADEEQGSREAEAFPGGQWSAGPHQRGKH